MKLKSIAKNQTELTYKSGNYILTFGFSYQTVIGVSVVNLKNNTLRGYITSQKISPTTSRHINQFKTRHTVPFEKMKQCHLENILESYINK